MNKIAATTLAALASLFANADAIERQPFEPLHRAAEAMAAAAAPDGSYERFSELARSLATELLAAKDEVHDDEDRALLMLYAQAGLAYGDSLAFWRRKISSSSAHVPAGAPDIAPLVARYALPTEGEDVDADAAIRGIWATAAKALRKAELLYDGRADELVVIMEEEARAKAAPGSDTGNLVAHPQPLVPEEAEHAAAEAAHQRAMMERVAREFELGEREAKRAEPYEVSPGNWTCPRGYVVRRGKCLSDEEVTNLPKIEVGD